MKLTALQNLMSVVELGSIRAAARHLNVAQPVITRSIQDLEKELKVVLFERSKKGVSLTPMGQVFLRRAAIATGELRRAQEELDQLRGETQGNLAIAMSMAPQITLLPNAMRQFRLRYPDVKLDIIDTVFPAIEPSLRDGKVDFYIGPIPEKVSIELGVEKVFTTQRVIVCRKGHPLAAATSLKELVGAEWITTSVTQKSAEEIGPLFAGYELPQPKMVMQAHSALTYVMALANSDLMMMLPASWAHIPMWGNSFQTIAVKEVLDSRDICIVQRLGLPLTPAAEYFSDLLRRQAGTDIKRTLKN